MYTKKILVPVDLAKPDKKINDFLYPDCDAKTPQLSGIKKSKIWEAGMVVMTSEISENDVFARIIDNSERKIKSADKMLRSLLYYLEEVKKYKIGNIISITEADNEFGFELSKIKERISTIKKNIIP